METRQWVRLASAGCFAAIVLSLIVAANLYRDINSLYYETLEDVTEFKEIANDVWRDVINAQMKRIMAIKSLPSSRLSFLETFVKRKRREYPSSCSCAPQPNFCSPGPPGPSGDPGIPG
ncbi:unnamed protein product [Toxocara canis]|uniref:Col_cuticle_N domain-containing protein n=1 Tax=Toxocara canis TaxID=6265 RepID=A0A183V0Y3_TOXCA|nr:unnamed protein product [Toxocara canis]